MHTTCSRPSFSVSARRPQPAAVSSSTAASTAAENRRMRPTSLHIVCVSIPHLSEKGKWEPLSKRGKERSTAWTASPASRWPPDSVGRGPRAPPKTHFPAGHMGPALQGEQIPTPVTSVTGSE